MSDGDGADADAFVVVVVFAAAPCANASAFMEICCLNEGDARSVKAKATVRMKARTNARTHADSHEAAKQSRADAAQTQRGERREK